MRRVNLDIDLLRCFATVVETGGFTAAAKTLLRTQSAVSVQIKRLETTIGHKLFERSKRAPQLTEQGEMLLGYAHRMLKLNDETVLRLTQTEIEGTLRLGVVEYLAPHRLPEIISRLKRAYPRLDLRLRIDLSSKLHAELEQGKLDVIIAARTDNKDHGQQLFREQLCWATGPLGIPESEAPVPLAVLPHPCFYRQAAINSLDEQGRPWYCAVTTMNISGVQKVIEAGLAVGVLSKSSLLPSMTVLGPQEGFPLLPMISLGVFSNNYDSKFAIEPVMKFIADCVVDTAHYAAQRAALNV